MYRRTITTEINLMMNFELSLRSLRVRLLWCFELVNLGRSFISEFQNHLIQASVERYHQYSD